MSTTPLLNSPGPSPGNGVTYSRPSLSISINITSKTKSLIDMPTGKPDLSETPFQLILQSKQLRVPGFVGSAREALPSLRHGWGGVGETGGSGRRRRGRGNCGWYVK